MFKAVIFDFEYSLKETYAMLTGRTDEQEVTVLTETTTRAEFEDYHHVLIAEDVLGVYREFMN